MSINDTYLKIELIQQINYYWKCSLRKYTKYFVFWTKKVEFIILKIFKFGICFFNKKICSSFHFIYIRHPQFTHKIRNTTRIKKIITLLSNENKLKTRICTFYWRKNIGQNFSIHFLVQNGRRKSNFSLKIMLWTRWICL
jgi:hypothetical protein